MVKWFERVWNHWERLLVTTLAKLQHSGFSSVSMCIEVVIFYNFHVTNKKIFTLVTFIFSIVECLHLMCFLILVPSRDWNHIFHNYDTKIEKNMLINEDDAHKVFSCTFIDLLKIFCMWPNHMNLQDGKHVDVLFKQMIISGSVFMKFRHPCLGFVCLVTF